MSAVDYYVYGSAIVVSLYGLATFIEGVLLWAAHVIEELWG